ncbi:hypothetical protein AB205_0093450, partial [Aquarana catesbeiana]
MEHTHGRIFRQKALVEFFWWNFQSCVRGIRCKGFNIVCHKFYSFLYRMLYFNVVSFNVVDCKIDLVFLIDGSWSIGKRRFRIQKLFLSQMADALDVGISGPLMGIVQYGDDPSTEFSLRSYFNSKDLRNAIEKIPQKGGYSNVGK